MERFGDEAVADEGAVGVGGVDEVYAQLDGSPQRRDRLVVIGWFPPDSRSGDAHGPKPETADGEIAPEIECRRCLVGRAIRH